MRIVVIGAGGIGGWLGTRLAASGQHVGFLVRGRTLQALRTGGLTLRDRSGGGAGTVTARVEHPLVGEDPDTLVSAMGGYPDLVLVTTKVDALFGLTPVLRRLTGPGTGVVSTQNGLTAPGLLADAVGAEHVLPGVARVYASVVRRGTIAVLGTSGSLAVGEWGGTDSVRVRALVDALNAAGIRGWVPDSIWAELWRKAAFVVPQGGLGALTDAPVGRLRTQLRDAYTAAVEEVVSVGQALSFTSLADIGWVALVGLVAGLAGLGFSKLLYWLEDVIDAFWALTRLPQWSRPGVLGLVLGGGLVAFPYMFGSGYPLEERAIGGEYTVAFLLALMVGRAVFTSFTIGMGGSGGVFAPTLFIGAMAGAAFGQVVAPLASSGEGVFAVIGMGAAFAGAARAPMTAVLIIVEMTAQFSLILPMMLAVVIATGASRFLTRSTIYTEKLRRRGDVLDDPVEGTLLGTKPVVAWMAPVPELLHASAGIDEAVAALRRTRESVLPVVRGGAFVGLVTSLGLAERHQSDGRSPVALGDLELVDVSVDSLASPSRVLEALRASGLQALPVLNRDRRVIGWVSERDLVDRMYRDQRRAIEAREQSSWGSRFQERHPRRRPKRG